MRRVAALLALVLAASPAVAGLPGEIDPTFNGGQPLVLNLSRTAPRTSYFNGVTLDPAGGFVLGGTATDASGQAGVVLMRLNADGAVDPSFASGGAEVLQLGLGSTPGSTCFDVEPRASGGWLCGGIADAADGRNAGLVAAFDANGMLDLGFGSAGSIRSQVAGPPPATWYAAGSAVAPDGSTLLTGMLDAGTPVTDRKLVVIKVTPGGNAATGFGNQPGIGAFVQEFSQASGSGASGTDLLVTSIGTILVVGTTLDAVGRNQLLLVRLLAGGTLDLSFAGGAGFVRRQVGDPAGTTLDSGGSEVAVGPNGEIYVGGEATDSDERLAAAVTRFTTAGVLDSTFAVNGTRRLQLGTADNARTSTSELLVQPDGKVVVVGSVGNNLDDTRKIFVARLDTEGDLDPSFGQGGLAFVECGERCGPVGAALSADAHAVVMGGFTGNASGYQHDALVTRMLLEPLPTTTTSTTLPGGCAGVPSLAGARCRVALLAGVLQAAVPPGKLATRLGRTLEGAGNRLASAEGSIGRALRKRLRKARGRLQRLRVQLDAQAAVRGIGADQRAVLAADTDALLVETAALLAAA